MAEQFIIRVKVDGQGNGSTSANGSDSWRSEAVGTGLLLGGALSDRKQFDILQKLGEKTRDVFGKPEDIAFVGGVDPDTIKRKHLIWQKISAQSNYQATSLDDNGNRKNRTIQDTPEIAQLNPAIIENRKKITAAGTALGFKLGNAFVSHAQHRSGDAYYNEILNRRMKSLQYASALGYGLATGGFVGAGLVATGIAVNETINIVSEAANYKYDRMMDTLYIHNVREVSGDISYGRRRRGAG